MDTVKIKDEEELVRDKDSNAVLNSSLSSLDNYRARRDMARKKDNEFESLKNDVKEIKELLQKMLNRD
jgi:predicted nuclease with TOPRIM domain